MKFAKLAALPSLMLVSACEGPALFVSALEPTQDTALDDRLLGAWFYSGANTSAEWIPAGTTWPPNDEDFENLVSPKHWQETVSLVIVPETSHTLSAVFSYTRIHQSQLPGMDEQGRGWGRMENGWLALSINATEIEGQTFLNARSEGGWFPQNGFDEASRLGPFEPFYIARVTLLDDDNLEIAPIWSHVVDQYLRSAHDDWEASDRLDYLIGFRCGWDCGVSAYDLSNDQLRDLIAQFSEEISETAVVFTRAPEVDRGVFHQDFNKPEPVPEGDPQSE